MRVFQGQTTKQLDGHTGQAAQADAWYYEPDDYTGDVLWSEPFATREAAEQAAEAEAEQAAEAEQENTEHGA